MFSLSCDGGAGVGSDCFCFSFYFCFSEMFRYCMLSTNNIHSVSNRLHSFGRLGLEGKIQTHVQQHSGTATHFSYAVHTREVGYMYSFCFRRS